VKKPKRIGTILVALGLSLLLIAVVRGGSPEIGQSSWTLPPAQQATNHKFLYPRDLKLEIETQTPITFKLQAPSGQLIIDLEDLTNSASYVYHLGERGLYLFLVYNPSNVTSHVRIITTFYNFESDLVESSLTLIVAGTTFIIASYAISLTRHKRVSDDTEGKTPPATRSAYPFIHGLTPS
jgi:hypothetical protein